jgi:hypothetical protein
MLYFILEQKIEKIKIGKLGGQFEVEQWKGAVV